MPEIVESHRRFLPHHQETQQIISLCWRLAFTLPRHLHLILQDLKNILLQVEKHPDPHIHEFELQQYAQKILEYDEFLGKFELEGLSLCEQPFAGMLCNALRFYAGNLYDLHAYCVMPNHLHLLIEPLPDANQRYHRVSVIVQRIKSYTSTKINQLRGKTGKVWSDDYYDRYIRSERDYYNVLEYILLNPVKAGLVNDWEDWEFSFSKWKE